MNIFVNGCNFQHPKIDVIIKTLLNRYMMVPLQATFTSSHRMIEDLDIPRAMLSLAFEKIAQLTSPRYFNCFFSSIYSMSL